MVGNVIPLMGNLCDQLTDQMSKVINQVRNLPNYQINWSAVRDVMRDLLKEFQKLRRITGKCLPLVQSDEHRRIVCELGEHIDRKMEACRSMGRRKVGPQSGDESHVASSGLRSRCYGRMHTAKSRRIPEGHRPGRG